MVGRVQTARGICFLIAASILFSGSSWAEGLDPEVARLMERALQDAENFRQEVRKSQYEARMYVQEWDGRGKLRGTARATAIMRPGDKKPMTFVSREMHGKVRLPAEGESSKEEEKEDDTTLLDFAREHRMSERYDFTVEGRETVAGDPAVRIHFSPNKRQPRKNRADRFLDSITGTAWVSEARNRLVKFEMRLVEPFQLFWILAVLKECTIQYELIEPGDILGHAKLKIVFALTTPVYSIRQQHDVELDHFRRRDALETAGLRND
jgi:hypothetical protein